MFWLLIPTYLVPLAVAAPWMAAGLFFFFCTLRVVGRLPVLARATYAQLPPEMRNKLRAITPHERRWYTVWCVVEACMGGLLVAVPYLFPTTAATLYPVTAAAAAGTAMALFYAPFYHDRSELLGDRAWPAMRRSSLWTPFRYYFNLTPVYLCRVPGDLAVRDDRRRAMKAAGATPAAIADEMEVIDTHAFLACQHEFGRFFSFSRRRYEDALQGGAPSMGVQARRARVYAAHPHGLSAITAVFGAVMYGPEPMLPDADNVRVTVADMMFAIPVIREWMLLTGCISVSREAIWHNLSRKRDVFLMPGGMLEQATTGFHHAELVWSRFGFCRLAFSHQADLVPIYAMGENDTYAVWNMFPEWRLRNYRRTGYAFPWVFAGPLPASLCPVIGLPIVTADVLRTEGATVRARRYFNRQNRHSRGSRESSASSSSSQGDTPLVELSHVTRSLRAEGGAAADVTRQVNDYYGTGYDDERRFATHSGWFVSRHGEDGHVGLLRDEEEGGIHGGVDDDDDDEELSEDDVSDFVTLIDTQLDNEGLRASSCIADIQRAFYAQFVDLRDCAAVGLPTVLPDVLPEPWGDTLHALRRKLNRANKARARTNR